MVLGIFVMSCGPGLIEVAGTWSLDLSGDTESFEISSSSITYTYDSITNDDWDFSWTGDIVEFDNDTFNADETGNGDFGYAVVQFKGGDDDGKYCIVRWQNLSTTDSTATVDISKGYKTGETYPDTPEDAKTTITDGNGWFEMYSAGMEKQTSN